MVHCVCCRRSGNTTLYMSIGFNWNFPSTKNKFERLQLDLCLHVCVCNTNLSEPFIFCGFDLIWLYRIWWFSSFDLCVCTSVNVYVFVSAIMTNPLVTILLSLTIISELAILGSCRYSYLVQYLSDTNDIELQGITILVCHA